MLKLTEFARTRNDSTSQVSYSRPQKAAVVQQPANGNTGRTDQIQLTSRAQQTKAPNPYEGTAPDYIKVKVGKWGSGDNDSLTGILNAQHYSKTEIYGKNAEGVSLLDQISRANNLKNPNLIREGQELLIPVKERQQAATGTEQTTNQSTQGAKPATNTGDKKAQVVPVKVGKWGQDKNGSLFGILNGQGFSREQILGKDGNGDSLLNKVARANGLADPNKIQEGATLNVPNSMEALAQMNVPESPEAKNQEVRRTPVPTIHTIEPRPIEIKPIEIKPIEIKPINPSPTPAPVNTSKESTNNTPTNDRVTVNMGLLLDGVKGGQFKKDEFQYLNSLSNRYEETRAQFSRGGFNNQELKTLGKFETNYGVTYTRLYNSDDVQLTNGTQSATSPKGQVRVRHYEEGGALWEGYKNGTIDSDAAIETMIRQRAEARAQGEGN